MIALVISACFLADPGTCRAFHVPVADQNDALACTLSAQPYLPQWTQEHPGWQMTKWGCARADFADL